MSVIVLNPILTPPVIAPPDRGKYPPSGITGITGLSRSSVYDPLKTVSTKLVPYEFWYWIFSLGTMRQPLSPPLYTIVAALEESRLSVMNRLRIAHEFKKNDMAVSGVVGNTTVVVSGAPLNCVYERENVDGSVTVPVSVGLASVALASADEVI
jgi:hypothetical protein